MKVIGEFAYRASRLRGRPASFVLRKIGRSLGLGWRTFIAGLGVRPYRVRVNGLLGAPLLFRSGEWDSFREFARLCGDTQGMLREAEKLKNGSLLLFGVEIGFETNQIDWQQDPLSGHRWDRRFHGRYEYLELLDLERPSDIRVAWELSRLQFLPMLALAYRISGDSAYATKAGALYRNWVSNNPVGYGVGWSSPMDAALRAISLLTTAEILKGSPYAPSFCDREAVERLAEHGRFVYENIEFSDINGNHHTACLVGLLFLGLQLRSAVPASTHWCEFALRRLRAEIVSQTYEDGPCHEGSIPYHRFVTELFMIAGFLAERGGVDLGEPYRQRLERMLEFVRAYTKPSGEAPLWGDTDDGRVLKLKSDGINDHRHLLWSGAAFLKRFDLASGAGAPTMDGLAFLDGLERETVMQRRDLSQISCSNCLRASGYCFSRAGEHYVGIECSDVGIRGRGGHGHNDALTIEVVLAGQEILTDSGCGSYSSSVDARVRCLSVNAHNLPVIDGQEPARIDVQRIPHATACRVALDKWESSEREDFFEGSRALFSSPMGSLTHRRCVRSDKAQGLVQVEDVIEGTGPHNAEWTFHLAESWRDVRLDGDTVVLRQAGLDRFVMIFDAPQLTVGLKRTEYYPSYAVVRTRAAVQVAGCVELPFKMRVTICPAPDCTGQSATGPLPAEAPVWAKGTGADC